MNVVSCSGFQTYEQEHIYTEICFNKSKQKTVLQ